MGDSRAIEAQEIPAEELSDADTEGTQGDTKTKRQQGTHGEL
jgi:hypothetical protein